MHLSSLSLENFRSYKSQTFDFCPQANLIIGPNGSGKTNILEAIFMLTGSPSFRGQKLSNIINWSADYCLINGKTDEDLVLEIKIKKHINSNLPQKDFLINEVKKTRKLFFGQLKAVVFQPDDIRLITGSPGRRRQYIDTFLSSIDWQYKSNLYHYQKALRQRNQLLQLISLSKAKVEQLFFWDKSLSKSADFIHKHRSSFFNYLNSFFQSSSNDDINTLSILYKPSLVSESILKNRLNLDLKTGQTSVGIHRDDFFLKSTNLCSTQDLSDFGSRGQQRIAIFAFKLGEISYITSKFSQIPILLLDDIYSELDPLHQQSISSLCYNHQVFITTAQAKDKSFLPNAKIYNL